MESIVIKFIKKVLVLMITIFFLAGCIMAQANRLSIDEELLIRNNEIYVNNKKFAELLFFMDAGMIRGFGIYYHLSNNQVWVYPKKGWCIEQVDTGIKHHSLFELNKIWRSDKKKIRLLLGDRPPSKGEFISTWCFDVKFSDDGRFVKYKTKGVLYDRRHQYPINYEADIQHIKEKK
ncbi:hypothetical protein [uncultured Desulfobacter sp.]|uniref:hypothetical protein n=1 Tax=uncultured Desulfobacter sp. TaxID=240139 RepID=UPI002AA85FF6|nr:hypothetical protein [uncultured Desulfobacter sp.]